MVELVERERRSYRSGEPADAAHKYADDSYCWPVTPIYAELLERSLALNHERSGPGRISQD
jgi:hypothetical protein